jgi:hypothetical protein
MRTKALIASLVAAIGGCSTGNQVDATAQKYDAARACWDRPLVVGSIPAGVSCDDALQVASKDGACFLFPSSCLPAGFRPLSSSDATCPQPTAPACPPAD